MAFVASANLGVSVLPRHTDSGYALKIASCTASEMAPEDLLIAPDWNWAGYRPYLYQRKVLHLLGLTQQGGGSNGTLETVGEIQATMRMGGKVFVPDVEAYDLDCANWFAQQTKLSLNDLRGLQGPEAFVCEGTRFRYTRGSSTEV